MLHVLVKTEDLGVRKAWYIDVIPNGEPVGVYTKLQGVENVTYEKVQKVMAIVVFKNNDNHTFRTVPLESVRLDTSYRHETQPVPENSMRADKGCRKPGSLRDINMRLKKKKEPLNFNAPMLCNICGQCHDPSKPCPRKTLPFERKK